jgi:hypothetical protein
VRNDRVQGFRTDLRQQIQIEARFSCVHVDFLFSKSAELLVMSSVQPKKRRISTLTFFVGTEKNIGDSCARSIPGGMLILRSDALAG